jgi:hypothetical protein
MPAHRLSIVPVRVRQRDDALGVDVSRIVAYRAVCSCGWRGRAKRGVAEARADYRDRHGA